MNAATISHYASLEGMALYFKEKKNALLKFHPGFGLREISP